MLFMIHIFSTIWFCILQLSVLNCKDMEEKIQSRKNLSRKKKFQPQISEESDFQPSASKQPRLDYTSINMLPGKDKIYS